jgi:tetratricopeptide (TPR) repeat protein
MVAERFLYLPSISFIILLSYIIVEAVGRLEGRTIVKVYLPLSLISILFLLLTCSRNNVWMNDRSIWEDTLKKNSLSFIAHSNLGTIYRDDGNYAEAIKEYKKAVFLQEKNAKIHFNLGLAYVDAGAYESALEEFVKARNIEPNNIQYIVNLGGINGMMGRHEVAVEVFKDALRLDPANEFAKNNLFIAEKAMSRKMGK